MPIETSLDRERKSPVDEWEIFELDIERSFQDSNGCTAAERACVDTIAPEQAVPRGPDFEKCE